MFLYFKRKFLHKKIKSRLPIIFVALLMSVAIALIFISIGLIRASTIIGTNISTTGTFTATDLATLGNASTTMLSVSGDAYLSGNVGIGTNTLSFPLQVVSGTYNFKVAKNENETQFLNTGGSSIVKAQTSNVGSSVFFRLQNEPGDVWDLQLDSSSIMNLQSNDTPHISFDGNSLTTEFNSTNADIDVAFNSLAGDNSLFIQGSDGNIGIGTNAPATALHVLNATEQLRIGYDSSNYGNVTVASDGETIFNTEGTDPDMTFQTKSGSPSMYFDDSIGYIGFGQAPSIYSGAKVQFISNASDNDGKIGASMNVSQTGNFNAEGMSANALRSYSEGDSSATAVGMSLAAQASNTGNLTSTDSALQAFSGEVALKYTTAGTRSITQISGAKTKGITRGDWANNPTINLAEYIGYLSTGFDSNYIEDGTINITDINHFKIQDSDFSTTLGGTVNATNQTGIYIPVMDEATNNYGIVLEDNMPILFGTDKDVFFSYDNASTQAFLDLTGVADTNFNINSSGDTNSLFVEGSTGNVSIGTASPTAKLDVDGIIKTAPRSTATCDATTEGGVYYDSDDNNFYGCNGSSWVQLNN